MNKNDILDKAKTIINGERQGTYGHAEDSFGVIAKLWSAFLGKELSSADVANMMILIKVARNSSGVYKDDNWIDICGYAALGGEIQDNGSKNESTGVFHLEEVIFPTYKMAVDVFEQMRIALRTHGEIAVARYYHLCDLQHFEGSVEYGWTSLDGVEIRRIGSIGEGYVIDLPEPQKL